MADFAFEGEHVYCGMVLQHHQTHESINRTRELEPVDGDVMIASYPKTGSTWMQELVWLIHHDVNFDEANSKKLFERIPFLETHHLGKLGIDILKSMPRPAIMKTHLLGNLLSKQIADDRIKIIITVRDPKDTLVSLYHFYRMNASLGNFPGSWDDFFELYKTKHLLYGDFFDWYSSWIPYFDRTNVQLISYEDMKSNIRLVIQRLCNFMGKSLSDKQVDSIIQHTSFTNMKSNDMTNYSGISSMKQDISPFIRKGIIGDWKNYFSREQKRIVDDEFQKRLVQKGFPLTYVTCTSDHL